MDGRFVRTAGIVAFLGLLLVTCRSAPVITPTPTECSRSFPSPIPSPTFSGVRIDEGYGGIRPAAFAGMWYPGDPAELTRVVNEMLAAVQPVDGAPLVLVVPHAAYVYSGPVAAAGFRQLEQGQVDGAIILASDHQWPLSNPVSVWIGKGFQTPLGLVPVDNDLAHELMEVEPRITSDPQAHAGEHVIEIELPFLQRVCPGCRIVPVLIGTDSPEVVQMLASALVKVLHGRRVVLIVSSDLSHYPTYDDALRVDEAVLAAIETGDAGRVRRTIDTWMAAGVPNLVTCACGEAPILVGLEVARALGAETITVLKYANSGDSPRGSRDQVVGYAAVMLWHYEPPSLTLAQRTELLELARNTLQEYLRSGRVPEYTTSDPQLTRLASLFVTLKKEGKLRGCVGHMRSDQPLYRAVQKLAIAAATEDPRFSPLTLDELPAVRVEISILSPLHRVTDLSQVEVGTHGLMLNAYGHQGVLLPQVAVEERWDREAFLNHLCIKAGLLPDCWQDEQASLYSFTAVVFGEE